MNAIRPLFLARHFWPRMDGATRTVADLAAELAARGHDVTVLTVLDHPQWPTTIQCRGASVERLPQPRPGRWGRFLHARRVARWLRENADRYNLIHVSDLRDDAETALWAVGRRVPVVLRHENTGPQGDCLWQNESSVGGRIKKRCMAAAALVGPSSLACDELKAAGYPRSRIHHIPRGVAQRPRRSAHAKRLARAALAESNAALDLPLWAPLAVYVGRLEASKRLDQLVAAWRAVADRWPHARLWLAGEGPERAALLRQIEARQLSDRVSLVGMFDQIDVLLDAADLFVSPSPDGDLPMALLEAMAAGLPVVARDTRGNREAVVEGQTGLLVPPGDAQGLAQAMFRLIHQPDLAAELGDAARQRVHEHFPLAKMIEDHITLFEKLIAG